MKISLAVPVLIYVEVKGSPSPWYAVKHPRAGQKEA
jgi:hypothetical protein